MRLHSIILCLNATQWRTGKPINSSGRNIRRHSMAPWEADQLKRSKHPPKKTKVTLPDRAAVHAERIARVKSQIDFHVKLRDRLKADFNQAAYSCKYSQDDLDRAKRPLLQAVSQALILEIDHHESTASELRARLKGLAQSALERKARQ